MRYQSGFVTVTWSMLHLCFKSYSSAVASAVPLALPKLLTELLSVLTACRYMLLLNVPGKGEECISSGNMFDGIATKEAQAVEQPMFEELGMMEAMQKPGAITAAINWYRYDSILA